MSKRHETRTQQIKVIVEIKCDVCGKTSGTPFHGWPGDGQFDSNHTGGVFVELTHRKGTHYPEMQWGKQIDIDLCPKCFEEMVDLLKSKGANIDYREWES